MRQRVPRALVPGLVLAATALLATGCGDDDATADGADTGSVALPGNLCEEIPESAVTRWSLTETDHSTANAADRSTASCVMTGSMVDADAGTAPEPVTLSVTITDYGDTAEADAGDRMADALESACRDLAGTAAGDLVTDDVHCNVATPAEPVELRGTVKDISRMVGIDGVLTVEMAHAGEQWQLVAPEVEGIAGSLNSGVGSPA